MLFPTIEFAVFFAFVFAVCWSLNDRNTTKKWFLVVASYFFYAAWSERYLLILFGSSVFNYGLALWLGRLESARSRLIVLWIGIAANLSLLGVFKYYNFFVVSFVDGFAGLGIRLDPHFLEVSLPIAISFLTFHALSYIVDVYYRRVVPTTSLVDILLYISFFPHLVAGPIVRARDFLAQTVKLSDPADVRLGESALLIVGGLFKKVVIANYLATGFVDDAFRNPAAYSSLDLLLATYAYALQIYCDFSAYTDIAIGVANLLGYRFPQNFNQPYRALGFQDFWRRWHITLSSWLRDYLYIPLGGSRYGEFATYRNLMITMVLGGLWHGAAYNFLIWGTMHGCALALERWMIGSATDLVRPWQRALTWFVTFHFVCLTWIFFRSPSFEDAQAYLKAMLWGERILGTSVTPLVALCMVLGMLTQVVKPEWMASLATAYDRSALSLKIAVPFVCILLIAVASPGGMPPFIYFQF